MVDLIDQYRQTFLDAGKEWDVDPAILMALAKHEGGGDPNARGKSGEIGMTQIMPGTAAHLGMTDQRDPVQQIYGAAKYMNEALTAEHDNPTAALRYYNGGPGWRSSRTDPNYPSYVAGNYARYAKADTGNMTDATPAAPPAESTSPSLAGPNADRAVDATGGGKDATVAQTAPASPAGPANGKSDDDPFTRALKGDDAKTTGDDPFTRALAGEGAPDAGKEVPPAHGMLHNLLAGGVQGLADVVHTGADLADWVDKRVPFLASLDKRYGIDPAAAANALETNRQAFEASDTGQSTAGSIGRFGGQMLATAPLMGPAGGLGEAGANLLLRGATGLIPFVARTAVAGATGGAAYGAATEGGSPAPLGEQVTQGAESGALLGPVAAGVARLAAPAINAGANLLRGSAPAVRDILYKPGPTAAQTAPAVPPVSPLEARVAEVSGRSPPSVAEPGAANTSAGPQPAGAQATPASSAALTPEQTAAYQATAEGRKLIEQQQPGIADRNAYVPGVSPNLAEQEQTAQMSRELKALKVASPAATQDDLEAAAANNTARQSYFEQIAGSPVDVANAKAARSAQADADLKATWANKTEADAQPVVDQAKAILDSPDGRRPAVRNAVNSVTNELQDANGALHSDPEQLYGVRKHIDDLLSKEGQRETPLSTRAMANLQTLKNTLDQSIEAAAPGFKQYLQNFSSASRKIDEMQVLQDHEPKLYDAQNRMGYNRVQTMMRNIIDSRGSQGINPYKSISDDTMGKLFNLRDDLRRSSSALELARANGSDTAQNAMDIAKQYAKMGGVAGIHAVANAISPGFGSMAIRGVSAGLAPIRAARAARMQAERARQILHPPHPLIDPNAAP